MIVLQEQYKIPAMDGNYIIHIWGKPENKNEKSQIDPVPEQRNTLAEFYKDSNLNLKTLTQTHGTNVIAGITHEIAGEPEADAFFTTDSLCTLAIKTADCIPILFYNSQSLIFGGIHCGWRGLYSGIVTETVEKLKSLYSEIFINFKFLVGPHIHSVHYETSHDVYLKFQPEFSLPSSVLNKKSLDMEGILRDQFKRCNIASENITWINENTYQSEKYFSHRFGDKGRNFNIVFFEKT